MVTNENGIYVDFATFLKWEEIDGYEWDHELLKLKINKLGVIRKIKIKPENIEKIQDIIEKKSGSSFYINNKETMKSINFLIWFTSYLPNILCPWVKAL
ncbi:hypothetical protein EXQ36_07235 [Clostridium botulinum]|nr:hypothetical protein [Clostridium botulinum]